MKRFLLACTLLLPACSIIKADGTLPDGTAFDVLAIRGGSQGALALDKASAEAFALHYGNNAELTPEMMRFLAQLLKAGALAGAP